MEEAVTTLDVRSLGGAVEGSDEVSSGADSIDKLNRSHTSSSPTIPNKQAIITAG
jgi:hypothetical protein